MAMDVEVICVKRKPEYFYKKGWTGGSVICPSGKRLRLIGTPAEDLLIEPQQPHHEDCCSETWDPHPAPLARVRPKPSQGHAKQMRHEPRVAIFGLPYAERRSFNTRMIELDVCSCEGLRMPAPR